MAKVLRNNLRMRYRRVKRTSPNANSEDCMSKRHECAKVLLRELDAGKRIINIDETWIGEMDYRRYKWCGHNEANSLSSKDVAPRLALLTAVDNLGGLYMAMTQVNTDHEVFGVFMTKLVGKLTTEDPDWMRNTIFMLDNAPYHKDVYVLEALRRQGCNIIFLGPYSWSAAPCELLYSAVKRTNLNP